MNISGVAGASPVPFPSQPQSALQTNPGGTSAAASPALQIAAGNHHHRPPVNANGPTPGTGAPQNPPAGAQGGTGINTLA
jgi:hypothetical protein